MTSSLRCAIYTRVSSDAGLEQDFNSLDAQRESAEAYVKSQAHEGWRLVCERFDDGGYSGGSTDRPGLQHLLDRIRERRVDVVVVYKVDRLTRSLVDFAKLVELSSTRMSFPSSRSPGLQYDDQHGPADPQRSAVLRPVRTRGHGRAHSRQDRRIEEEGPVDGGDVPLGHRVEKRKLYVDQDEAATVRLIFDLYLELGQFAPSKEN
jgi:DNA invertase Pin-like site-specific DNA recombinase